MHADFQTLLALRDAGPVDVQLKAHLEQCADCSRKLAQLTAVKHNLHQLPFFEPPARAWSAIQTELQRQPQRRPSKTPIAAFAASVAIAVLVLPLIHREPPLATGAQTAAERDSLSALMDRSQRLDAVLQVLPPRPQVERAGTSATIDELQNRIQLLDLQLSASSKAELPQGDAQRLWSARVELMNSLVQVRYAQAAGSADLAQPSNIPGAI
jgi:hypothetical protein